MRLKSMVMYDVTTATIQHILLGFANFYNYYTISFWLLFVFARLNSL